MTDSKDNKPRIFEDLWERIANSKKPGKPLSYEEVRKRIAKKRKEACLDN